MAGTGDKLLTAAEIKEVTDTKVDKDFSTLAELPNGLSNTDLINVRRSGSNYKLTGADLAPISLGETSSTAYRGDRGKVAYDHATAKGSAFSSGLYKITTNAEGHVTAATSVAKADITGLGIPGSDTNTHRPIQVNGTEILGNNTTALNLKAGSNVTLTNSSGTVTVAATDTTYSSKSAASGGTAVSLVTTGEKYTWNNKSNLAIGTSATTAAAGNHTHTLSLATNSGTSKISLAANTKYQLTAGGSTYIFTTPPDTNTWRGIQNNLTSTSTSDSLSAYQGKILSDRTDDSGWKTLSSTYGCYYRKFGPIVSVVISDGVRSSGTLTIGTLPAGYRPKIICIVYGHNTDASTKSYMQVGTNGEIVILREAYGGFIANATYMVS